MLTNAAYGHGDRNTVDGMLSLIYKALAFVLVPPCAIYFCCIGSCKKRQARKNGETVHNACCGCPFGVTSLNLLACNVGLVFTLPISLLLRSNDINYRVIDACLYGVIKKANVRIKVRPVEEGDASPAEEVSFERAQLAGGDCCLTNSLRRSARTSLEAPSAGCP